MSQHAGSDQFRIECRDARLFRWRVAGDGMRGLGPIWTDVFLTRRGAERFIRRHTWQPDRT